MWFQLTEVTLQQALESLAVAGLGMGDLMDGRFQGLELAHILLNGDPLVCKAVERRF